MLPSLDTVLSMWFTAVPVFEWEPEPVTPPPDGELVDANTPCVDNSAVDTSGDDESRAGMRRVFKGYEWIPTPVWTQRESAAWEMLARNHREEDDERSAEKAKPAARPQPPQEPATDAVESLGDEPAGDTGLDLPWPDEAGDWERP
jgi:hypothetical protein